MSRKREKIFVPKAGSTVDAKMQGWRTWRQAVVLEVKRPEKRVRIMWKEGEGSNKPRFITLRNVRRFNVPLEDTATRR